MQRFFLSAMGVILLAGAARAGGRTYEVKYAPDDNPGKMKLGVTYTLWVPDGVKTLRGVIVHQHGCGEGACKGGETAAFDLHWRALARKWDCALLGPSYHQSDKQNCRLWCDPRNGSAKTFLAALDDFAKQSKHPELSDVPWCLWGHSGGGFWASLMQALYPERCVAIWFRSGTALGAWEKGEIPKPELSDLVYQVPIALNPGAKEKGDKRFGGLWTASEKMFRDYRAKGAPAMFAADPGTGHECGDSRYLAIPFFDTCLALRLPEKGNKMLKRIDAPKPSSTENLAEASWLPNEAFAKLYAEYVAKGVTSDTTPPLAPNDVTAKATKDGIELTWDAVADFESGLRGFVVLRDGVEVRTLPEKTPKRPGRSLFQGRSYHDTPERPLPAMRFLDKGGKAGAAYAVIAVNGAGLRSSAAKATPR